MEWSWGHSTGSVCPQPHSELQVSDSGSCGGRRRDGVCPRRRSRLAVGWGRWLWSPAGDSADIGLVEETWGRKGVWSQCHRPLLLGVQEPQDSAWEKSAVGAEGSLSGSLPPRGDWSKMPTCGGETTQMKWVFFRVWRELGRAGGADFTRCLSSVGPQVTDPEGTGATPIPLWDLLGFQQGDQRLFRTHEICLQEQATGRWGRWCQTRLPIC